MREDNYYPDGSQLDEDEAEYDEHMEEQDEDDDVEDGDFHDDGDGDADGDMYEVPELTTTATTTTSSQPASAAVVASSSSNTTTVKKTKRSKSTISSSNNGKNDPVDKTQQNKRKITRIRPLRSCLTCNRRKIKCDRETPCGPCSKRGESDACSLVAGLDAAHLTNSAIVERLAQLEERVKELEFTSTSRSSSVQHDPTEIKQERASSSSFSASKNRNSSKNLKSSNQASSSNLWLKREPSLPFTGTTENRNNGIHHHHQYRHQNGAQTSVPNTGYSGMHNSCAPPSGPERPRQESVLEDGEEEGLPSDLYASVANCETEEAALALESLCRTGEVVVVGDKRMIEDEPKAKASFSLQHQQQPAVINPAVLNLNHNNNNNTQNEQKLPSFASILLGPPSSSTSSSPTHPISIPSSSSPTTNDPEPRLTTMSPSEREKRSTIIIDPTGGRPGHRTKRSLEIRHRVLTSPNFPDKDFCDFITGNYFRNLDCLWHVHIGWLFDDEYKVFWTLMEEKRYTEIDPAWAALFLMTLALGLQVTELPLPQHRLPYPSATTSDILALADSYITDVEELLTAADWARHPQIRVLQTLALLSAFQSITSLVDCTTFTMNGAAIRIAQILGLHDLGEVKKPKPLNAALKDDPALPTRNEALKDHLARIIWHSLVVLELAHVLRTGMKVPLACTPYSTQLPSNNDDGDFKGLAPGETVKAKPTWQLTSVSSLHLRSFIVNLDKRLLDLPANMKITEKYAHVMSIDAELRKWISASPKRLAAQNDMTAYKLSQWQHWSIMADVHSRVIHVHRPYMILGYTDARFSFSTKTCLESAKVLVESWQHLKDFVTDQRFWWSSMRYLSAALVTFIELFTVTAKGCPEEVLADRRADIPFICNLLQERMGSVYATSAAFAGSAYQVVTNLLEQEQEQKAVMAAIAAKTDSVDGAAVHQPEPVWVIFKRLAQSMRDSAIKVEPHSAKPSASIATNQSSPQDLLSTSMRSTSALTEQLTFAQPMSSKKAGKQSRHAPVQQSDTSSRPAKQPKLSPETSRRPSVLSEASVADSSSQGTTEGSPVNLLHTAQQPTSSSQLPQFSMGAGSAVPQYAPYGSNVDSSTLWFGASPSVQHPQPQHTPLASNREESFESSSYLPPSFISQDYGQQNPATISWDVSGLFSSDSSVLLQTMGFPAMLQRPDSQPQPHFSHSSSTTPTLQAQPTRGPDVSHPEVYGRAQATQDRSPEHTFPQPSAESSNSWYSYQHHYETQ